MSSSADIWLEKYRPKTLDDVQGNEPIIKILKKFIQAKQVQHMILAGPPGVGKTTSIICLAKAILGDKFSEAVKEMNASDDRGIDVVRNEIKDFTMKTVYLEPGLTKIMILDEADSLTEGAQQALRMIISNSTDTRFVLSCNEPSKLIAPLQSRCIVLKFKRLKETEILASVKSIAEAEGVKISPEALEALVFISEGDMRQAINNLQACHQGVKHQESNIITKKQVMDICDYPNTDIIKQIFRLTLKKDVNKIIPLVRSLFKQGHSTYDIASIILKVLVQMEQEIGKHRFMQVMMFLAEMKRRVFEGVATELQIIGFFAKCCEGKRIEQM